ncbi:hypothetical protein Tco_1370912 [Tanacetum coccineum]
MMSRYYPDRRLIELENQVQRLMEAHLAPKQPIQVNKITSSCEICSGPHNTHYCMKNSEQAFVDYTSSRTDEAGGKWYTFKPEQNNLGDTCNLSWKSHPNLRFIMDDPNITMEEYIRLEEEKAQRQGQTFNWQTATYGKIEYCENEDDSFTNLKTNYPAIVFDDTSDAALSCEPKVSPLDNNEIDFNISFYESEDEDYMVIFDVNSFSCKIIYVDNLKTNSEEENDKVNMPSSLSPKPMFGYIDDLDFFKDFENEFPTIAYNDLKSKSDPPIEPSIIEVGVRRRMTWRRFILALGLHSEEEMAEAGDTYEEYTALILMLLVVFLVERRGGEEWLIGYRSLLFEEHGPDGTANVSNLLATIFVIDMLEGRKSDARLSGVTLFGSAVSNFAWLVMRGLRGPERQQVAADGAPGAAEEAHAADEGAQAVPAPVQAPQPPPPAP